MSKTLDLDKTISLLNERLAKTKPLKDWLAITDRLARCYALKLKYDDAGKGGKFSQPSPSNGAADDVGSKPAN
jgi:hypothetical protein